MVSSRKRGRQEMETVEVHKEPSLLERIRNMWEFANLVQYIYTFGAAVKIDENLDVEDLEMECLKTHSTILPEIGLALLKFVSSHRGLTPEIFDEYTRRQYIAKAPERNPFGVEEEPAKFNDFDIFTKIRVLQQLSIWTFGNPDRIREKMTEQKDSEQTLWRIEPFGWDAEDRTYIVLDDNRLYRRTDPPPPPPPAAKPKKNSKKAKAALRASKRRRVSAAVESDADSVDDQGAEEQEVNIDDKDDTFGGMKWECLAVTLDDFTSFIATIEKSRDPNEKLLRKRIMDDVFPILEKQEESRKRKAAQKQRELENLEKLATAKRSSRIAGRQEQQKQEEEAREAERKKQAELAMAKKEQEKWMKLEKERESRMQTREQRLKEREARRILHEEELANLSEDSKKIETGSGRLSERHLKAEIERKKKALEEIAEEDDWIFDCICGSYGKIDDGTHSIACDKCNIWQHSKCVGVSQAEAERADFSFVCQTCKRRAADAERAKTHPPIKIKINRPGSSSSPMPAKQNGPVTSFKTPNANAHVIQAEAVPKLPRNGISSQQSPQKPAVTQAAPSPIKFRSVHGQSPQQRPTNTAHLRSSPHSNGTNPFQPPTVSGPAPSAHAFSSPQPHSPYILAPPAQPFAYPSTNGYPPQYTQGQPHTLSRSNEAHNGYVAQSPPQAQGYQSVSPQVPASRPMSSGSTQVMPPTPQVMNGQPQVANSMDHRRSSFNMSSPLVGVPVLTPMNKSAMPFSANGTPAPVFNPSAQSTQFSPPQRGSSPITQEVPSKTDPSQAAALPPASSGISPTKHSPPTPKSSIANGILGPVTPTVLPPVASLSPSPQLQNLSPPVKLSKPETTPQSSQSVS